jgi:hypothetical protein
MTDQQNEWKIVENKYKGVVYTKGNDTIGWNFCYVDKTLLDQIHREAKKKLFYEIKKELFGEDISCLINKDDWKKLRAKTLGEKQ